MKAEIIAVGTEILLGQIVNTNAAFMSDELAELGIDVFYETVVGDNRARLLEVLEIAAKRSDLVILSGGLGPTDDDLTKQTVAEFMHQPLVTDNAQLAYITQWHKNANRPMPSNNALQAMYPKDGQIIPNPIGLAIGSYNLFNGVHYMMLPGPPSELLPMFKQEVRPILEAAAGHSGMLVSRVLRFFGIGESKLVTDLDDLIKNQTDPTVAPYAKDFEVTLRITTRAASEELGMEKLNKLADKIIEREKTYFYGNGDDNSLEAVVVNELIQRHITISAAESLTAGLFQATLGSISGVSAIFEGGFVTYAPKQKEMMVGVDSQLIERNGVVSAEVAKAMADGCRQKAQATLGVSFTGVAGPDELEGQSAGTVYIGLSYQNQPTVAFLCHFPRTRNAIRQQAVMTALMLIHQHINHQDYYLPYE